MTTDATEAKATKKKASAANTAAAAPKSVRPRSSKIDGVLPIVEAPPAPQDEVALEVAVFDVDADDQGDEQRTPPVAAPAAPRVAPTVSAAALGAYAMHAGAGVKPGTVSHAHPDRVDYLQRFAPMVRRIAHHMLAKLPASVQLEDLVQAGLIGLMDAINRFEEGQGAQFETYAMQRIRGAMLDELRSNDWLPRGLRKTQRTIETAIHRLEQKLGRAPAEQEIANELNISLVEYQGMLQDARGTQLVYLDDHDDDGDGEHFLDRHLPDTSGDPSERFNDRRFREALVGAIESLPDREKTIMALYYEQELNFREIAAILGVTESRICQIHTQIMARLRVKMRDW